MKLRTLCKSLRSKLTPLRPNWLSVEVKAHLPVLPVLRGQIEETAKQVEKAVVEVCSSFRGIMERARKTVTDSSRLLGGEASSDEGGQAGMDVLIDVSHDTILHLLERMESNADRAMQAVERMEAVESAMRRMTAAVAEVDRIAFANKLLALNAKIQAVHVGELGSGFGVVADAISNQAQRSTQLSEEIGTSIREVSAAALKAARDLREMVIADKAMLASSRREAEATLEGLRHGHERAREAVAAMTARSSELADEISRAVVGLQFQDRVSQRLLHVNEALESMENALRNPLRDDGAAPQARHQEIVAGLASSYTMDSERAVLASASAAPEPSEADNGGDVELF
jgi:methyl-accepting chemotaxis protein